MEPLWELLCGLYRTVEVVWKADDRPEARRFTLGCAAVVLVIIVLIALSYR